MSSQISARTVHGGGASRVLLWLARGELAVDGQQGATWRFSRASASPRKLSFRVVRPDGGYRRGPRHKNIRGQISARWNREDDRLRPRLMEAGRELSCGCEPRDAPPYRNRANRELSIKESGDAPDFH